MSSFASQQGSGPTDESQKGRTPGLHKRTRAVKVRPGLKVKLPKLSSSSKTASLGWIETTADSQSAEGSVYFFSEMPSNKAAGEKEKATLSVLRTISKMLEENQLIRQRLTALPVRLQVDVSVVPV